MDLNNEYKVDSEPSKETREISVYDIINFFKRNLKILAILFMSFTSIFVLMFLFLLSPVYRVDGLIEVNDSSDSISLNPMNFMMGGQVSSSMVANEELFRSRLIANRVINNLNLQVVPSRKSNSMFFYVLNVLSGKGGGVSGGFRVENYPDVFKSGSIDLLLSEKGYTVIHERKEYNCSWGEDCKIDSDTLNIVKLGRFPYEERYTLSYRSALEVREMLRRKFSASYYANTSNLRLQFVDSNPYHAAKILEEYVRVFLSIKNEWDEKETIAKRKYITNILDDVKNEIKTKAELLIETQQSDNTFMPNIQFETAFKKIESIKGEVETLKMKQKLINETLAELDREPDKAVTISYLSDNLSLIEMIRSHNELIYKLDSTREQFTENHPRYISLNALISESSNNISTVLLQEKSALDSGIKILNHTANVIIEQKKDFPKNILKSEALRKDLELTEKLYVALTTKLYESTIDRKTGVPAIKVIDNPDPLVFKSSPGVSFNMLIILFLSLVIATVSVFLIEFFRDKVKNIGDVKRTIGGFPVFYLVQGDSSSYVDRFKDLIKYKAISFKRLLFFSPADSYDFKKILAEMDFTSSSIILSFGPEKGVSVGEFADSLKNKEKISSLTDIKVDKNDLPFILNSSLFFNLLSLLETKYDKIIFNIVSDTNNDQILKWCHLCCDHLTFLIKKDNTNMSDVVKLNDLIRTAGEKDDLDIFVVFSDNG